MRFDNIRKPVSMSDLALFLKFGSFMTLDERCKVYRLCMVWDLGLGSIRHYATRLIPLL